MFFINRPTMFFNMKELDLEEHPLHLHNYFEIIHLLEGTCLFQYGTRQVRVHSGDILFVPPHIPHAYQTINEDRTTDSSCGPAGKKPYMRITSSCVDILPMHKKNLLEKIPLSPVLSGDRIHPDILYAEKRLMEMDPHQDNTALISALISLSLCRIFPQVQLTRLEKVSEDNLTSSIIAYIASHCVEEMTLEVVGKEFGLSRYKVSRIFSNVLNTNFNGYVNSLRINHAQFLLMNTDQSVISIAMDCGFNNQQTFNRVFRDLNGCTPGEYRKKTMRHPTFPELEISFAGSVLHQVSG